MKFNSTYFRSNFLVNFFIAVSCNPQNRFYTTELYCIEVARVAISMVYTHLLLTHTITFIYYMLKICDCVAKNIKALSF